MTIVPITSTTDGSVTYTVNLTNVAKADVLEGVSNKVTTLIDNDNDANKSVRTIANEELAKQLIPEGAQESLDTLQEIAAWIQAHPGDAADMNTAISANTQSISDEVTARENADKTLQNNIDAEETARKNAITAVTASYEAADKAINDKIGTIADGKTVVGLISEEATARTNADNAINAKIGDVASGQTVVGLIEAERTAREQAISGITSVVENLDATVSGKTTDDKVKVTVTQVNGKITGVTVEGSDIASAAALTKLTNAISAEATNRENADNAINAKIGGSYTSASTVHAAITANTKSISDEATARANADTTLQSNIDKKADKTTVNSIDTRLQTVEGAYVKQVKVTTNGETKTYSPVNNVLDLSGLVIDGGTY